MKKIRLIIVVILGTAMLIQCDSFLEENPKSIIAPESFFRTEEECNLQLNSLYSTLQQVYNFRFDCLVTDIEVNGWYDYEGFADYTFTAENSEIEELWQDLYDGIMRANTAIDRIAGADIDSLVKNRMIGEAKAIRGLYYFNAVRLWGSIPLIVNESTPNVIENTEQSDAMTVYNQIIEDLDYAIDNCMMKSDPTYKPGRVTSTATKAILSKVYLTRGSMKKRDNMGNHLEDYTEARKLANEVILDAPAEGYGMVQYWPDIFHHKNQNNEEILLDVQKGAPGTDESDNYGLRNTISGEWNKGGSWEMMNHATLLHTMYEESDSVRRDWATCHIKVVDFDSLIVFPDSLNDFYDWNYEWGNGKYRRFPVDDPDSYDPTAWNAQFIIMRLAEVYMIYAEAENEINGPTIEAISALNMLRERLRNVNMADNTGKWGIHSDIHPRDLKYVDTSVPDLVAADFTQESLLAFIQDERAREFSSEMIRWFDLVRWGILVERVRWSGTTIHPGHLEAELNWFADDNIDDHHVLLPIPAIELRLNDKFVQNQGY
ncbi:MAG: RagB/SusD family nutrient uptake outer membrane protein [Bacteroidales bacterium]